MLLGMGKHRGTEGRRWGFFGRHKEIDSLFERSFQPCAACGEDVYVLADGCRQCGQAVELVKS